MQAQLRKLPGCKVALGTGGPVSFSSCLSVCLSLSPPRFLSILSTFSNSAQGTSLVNPIACPIGEHLVGLQSANGWACFDQVTSPDPISHLGSAQCACVCPVRLTLHFNSGEWSGDGLK